MQLGLKLMSCDSWRYKYGMMICRYSPKMAPLYGLDYGIVHPLHCSLDQEQNTSNTTHSRRRTSVVILRMNVIYNMLHYCYVLGGVANTCAPKRSCHHPRCDTSHIVSPLWIAWNASYNCLKIYNNTYIIIIKALKAFWKDVNISNIIMVSVGYQ